MGTVAYTPTDTSATISRSTTGTSTDIAPGGFGGQTLRSGAYVQFSHTLSVEMAYGPAEPEDGQGRAAIYVSLDAGSSWNSAVSITRSSTGVSTSSNTAATYSFTTAGIPLSSISMRAYAHITQGTGVLDAPLVTATLLTWTLYNQQVNSIYGL